ncbi:hypothetical protein [Marispirochaeta aestuarii]|uniref:hypothetical protein n=1 Tax=Marispirochaeta aestuarii TaxID=1963862 RepID=UPI0029C6F42D|nr:hypothetical protein [Marispirochaeta aestuarii]
MKKLFYLICARIYGPELTARIVYFLELKKQISAVVPNVLVHSRSIFSKDILRMKDSERIRYLILSNSLLSIIQSVWLPRYAREQSFYYDRLKPESRAWKMCEAFAGTLLSLLKKNSEFIGVLSANFDYWQDAAFRASCSKDNLAFMVLRRENEATEKARAVSMRRYADVRIGTIDLVMVFSESSKKLLESIKSENIVFKDIVVTGPPRLDRPSMIPDTILQDEKDSIVIFSYINGNYCDDPRNFWEVVKHLYRFSEERGLSFIIKCKSEGDKQALKNAFSEHDLNPERVDWRVAETPIDVVNKAIVAISFNSTVLYQLLSLNVPLIIPFVYASEQEKDDAILHNSKGMDEAGIFRVDTMQELDVELNRIIANRQKFDFTHQFRLSLRENYLSWDPANPSARRVEETILLLNNRRSKNR